MIDLIKKQKILNFQIRLEKKIHKFKNISFTQWLYAWIGFSGIQAVTQYFILKYPEVWQDPQEIGLLEDPAFYLGLMFILLMALFITRKMAKH